MIGCEIKQLGTTPSGLVAQIKQLANAQMGSRTSFENRLEIYSCLGRTTVRKKKRKGKRKWT